MDPGEPGRPCDTAEPEQGTRFTSGRRPMFAAIRASTVGTASPVLDTITIVSTSSGAMFADSSADSTAC
jgi:hypothetical protein